MGRKATMPPSPAPPSSSDQCAEKRRSVVAKDAEGEAAFGREPTRTPATALRRHQPQPVLLPQLVHV